MSDCPHYVAIQNMHDALSGVPASRCTVRRHRVTGCLLSCRWGWTHAAHVAAWHTCEDYLVEQDRLARAELEAWAGRVETELVSVREALRVERERREKAEQLLANIADAEQGDCGGTGVAVIGYRGDEDVEGACPGCAHPECPTRDALAAEADHA